MVALLLYYLIKSIIRLIGYQTALFRILQPMGKNTHNIY